MPKPVKKKQTRVQATKEFLHRPPPLKRVLGANGVNELRSSVKKLQTEICDDATTTGFFIKESTANTAVTPSSPPIQQRTARNNNNKPMMSLIMDARKALEGAADILKDGIVEYDRASWRGAYPNTEIMDSLGRHLFEYASGDTMDRKTGKPHPYFILCNALFLAENYASNPELDDRPFIDGVRNPLVPAKTGLKKR